MRALDTARWPKQAVIFAGVVAVAALLTVPIPDFVNYRLIISALTDAVHGPIFAGLALLFAWFIKPQSFRIYFTLLALLIAFGTLMEFAQDFTERDFSFIDLQNNVIGAAAGLALWAVLFDRAHNHAKSFTVALSLFLLLAAAVILAPVAISVDVWIKRNQQFPTLFDASFPQPLEMTESVTQPEDVNIRLREDGVMVDLQGGHIPGIVLTGISPDWSRFDTVFVELENSSNHDLNLAVLIGDFEGSPDLSDRFYRELTLMAGERRDVTFALADIRLAPATRTMPIDKISEIVLYRTHGDADQFLLHSIHLE
ncbi:MAG: hypothetical protein RIC89_21350 [Pseudomonadales bacterium]